MCGKVLVVDRNIYVVDIYYEQRGIYFGSRVTKCCRICKIYEYYSYWIQEGKRYYNDDCLSNEFLLLFEDIVFQNTLVRQCANFLVVGVVLFVIFVQIFNRRFGYDGTFKSNYNGI